MSRLSSATRFFYLHGCPFGGSLKRETVVYQGNISLFMEYSMV